MLAREGNKFAFSAQGKQHPEQGPCKAPPQCTRRTQRLPQGGLPPSGAQEDEDRRKTSEKGKKNPLDAAKCANKPAAFLQDF